MQIEKFVFRTFGMFSKINGTNPKPNAVSFLINKKYLVS